MIPFLSVMLVIVAIIGLSVAARIAKNKEEQKRTREIQSIAEELGWDFEPIAPVDTVPGIDRISIFEPGHDKQVKNLMYGEVDGVNATVFDYIYTLGSKYPTTYFQSVVLLEPDDQNFPAFSLWPEGVFDKMFSAFGYQDIDFSQRSEFSRRYILRGEDESAIRRIFNDRVLSFYESNPDTFTDAGDNQLFVYRAHHRLQPAEIESYVGLALEIPTLMRQ